MFKYIICLIWIDLLDFSPQATPIQYLACPSITCSHKKKPPVVKLDNRRRIVLRLDIIT